MSSIYSLFIRLYAFGIRLAAKKNEKARLWLKGRKNWRDELSAFDGDGCVWFHCASLGEFEQGRPIIEAIKANYPSRKVLITFYSPSGYEVRKNYPMADHIMYLPLDTRKNARDFLRLLNPDLAVFVKYEIWPFFFQAMHHSKIPLLLISVHFREDQRFFRSWGGWFRKALRVPEHFFVQDEKSKRLLKGIGLENVTISGDTRFDRVVDIAQKARPIPTVEDFIADRYCLVAGSSWQAEERVFRQLTDLLDNKYCFIIAPHEINEQHLSEIETRFSGELVVRYSKAQLGDIGTKRVLLMDNMGMLSRVYRYGIFALIGGGYGKGLHNTLEAAVYGIPLAFGPNHKQFKEALELLQNGAAISDESESNLVELIVELLNDEEEARKRGEAAKAYVHDRVGATQSIMNYLVEKDLIREEEKML